MQTDKQFKQSQPPPTRGKIGLFYYERVGSRYYLHFTRLTVMLVVGLTVISIVTLLALFFLSGQRDVLKEVNVNITIPKPSPNLPTQTIIQPTPVQQPKPIKQPIINIPAPSPPKVDGITTNAPANTQGQTKSNSNSNEP